MENIVNTYYYGDITSQDSSDESLYYSVSDSPDLTSYEEINDYAYSSETDSSSVYSTTFEPAPAYWIEVLRIFPAESRGTTYYHPLFYYVPVYSNSYYTYSPDLEQEDCETESTEYCSPDSDTDVSSLTSDTYYTAEETQSDFESDGYDYGAEEFGYFNENNLETTSFEFFPSDDFDFSEGNENVASESSKGDEEEGYDNVDLQNEVKYISIDNIKDNKIDKHLPFYIGDFDETSDLSETCPTNTFEFENENHKDCQNQGLKKYNSFDDLSGTRQRQPLKKQDTLKNLSTVEDDEMHEKDFQRDNTEIRMDSYEQNEEPYCENGETEGNVSKAEMQLFSAAILSPHADDFELTEEEVKYLKDEIYRRALSGKLYQKPHIPSVDVLPTIHEENESFGKIDEQADSRQLCLTEVDSQPSCFIEDDSLPSCLTEHQGLLNGSLCNLFEPSAENGENSEESQQKPKKKRMKRLREFMARIFCCVKPP